MISILDLEPLEHNLFRGSVPQVGWQRVFGGLVISQALVAACRTVEGMQPHSLHGYFLLGGDPLAPIVYEVDRIRDGKSFATRRVVAIQHGRAIFAMSASYHVHEEGYSHQTPMPDVPAPDDLPRQQELGAEVLARLPAAVRAYFEKERPIELRPVEHSRYFGGDHASASAHFWLRATHPLPDDPTLHRCVLAYASDMTLLDIALGPHGTSVFDPRLQSASLDHAMWFHRDFRADEWLLYAQDSPSAEDARGFSRGLIFRRDGVLVASVCQEGLIRLRRPKS